MAYLQDTQTLIFGTDKGIMHIFDMKGNMECDIDSGCKGNLIYIS